MQGKNRISNVEVKGEEFFKIKNFVEKKFDVEDIKKIHHVVKGKKVYELIVNNSKSYRLDLYPLPNSKYEKRGYYQKLAYENDVHVPKIIGFYKSSEFGYKVSEWIKGKRIGYYWKLPDLFKKAGIEIAKINLTIEPKSNCFLGYNDFSKPNAIWSDLEEIYLIDIVIEPKRNVDYSVAKILLKNLKGNDNRIEWFLDGYSQVRNSFAIEKIIKKSKNKKKETHAHWSFFFLNFKKFYFLIH